MDGLARVQERISDIEARVGAIANMRAATLGISAPGGTRGVGLGLAGPPVTSSNGAVGVIPGDDAELGAAGFDDGSSSSALFTGPTASSFEAQYAALVQQTKAAQYGLPVGGVPVGTGTVAGIGSSAAPSTGAARSGRTQPPAEFVPYGNGRIPEELLVPVGQGGHKLHAPASASYQQMRADAAAQGIDLKLTDSYRPYEEQVDLARRKGLYSQGGLAAQPGTSIHGWGLAIDINVNDPTTLSWLRANAGRYGWVEPVPREAWHWEYRG
jgi:zinc D-Ala-D-Ala carboxypeptidase